MKIVTSAVKYILLSIDMFFLMRPLILVPVWGFSIFGYICRTGLQKSFSLSTLGWGQNVMPFGYFILFSLAVGSVYLLNQLADLEVDSHNDGFPLMVHLQLKPNLIIGYATFLSLLSIVIPLITGTRFVALLSLCALTVGLVYCFKPFYFTGRPFADFLTNALGFGIIAFAVGWFLAPVPDVGDYPFWSSALPYFLFMCGGSISSTLPDYYGDKKVGKRTTAVFFGIFPAHLLASFFIIGAGYLAFVNNDRISLILAFCSFPIYFLFSIKQSKLFMEATYKIGGSIAMLLAGLLYPLFIPIALSIFMVTWVYFRIRHGVSYPSLIPVKHENNRS